jgi:peptidoglycan/LPS O-acetylase OafA/YrhL
MTSPLTYEAFRSRTRLPALDGVRAFAMLGVLLHHTRNAPFGRLHGFRGVWLFFVLSGFLITTLALREEDRAGALNIRAFAIRRVLRIMPLFYLALLVYLCWVCVFGMEPGADLLQHSLLSYVVYCPEFPILHDHFMIPFGQAWSLGIEEKFYLLWPLLAFIWLARSKHRTAMTVALLVTTLLLTAATTEFAQMWGSYSDILIGCLLGFLLHDRRGYERIRTLGRTDLTWMVLLALAVVTVSRLTGTQLGDRLFSLTAAAAIAALVTNTGKACRPSLAHTYRRVVLRHLLDAPHRIRCVEPLFTRGPGRGLPDTGAHVCNGFSTVLAAAYFCGEAFDRNGSSRGVASCAT